MGQKVPYLVIKDMKKAQMWSWHILHPEAVANGLVNNTRGMFLSNRGLYSNNSTDLAKIWASLCVNAQWDPTL